MSRLFSRGPAVVLPNSVHLGFGFEGIDNANDPSEVMDRVMQHFGQ